MKLEAIVYGMGCYFGCLAGFMGKIDGKIISEKDVVPAPGSMRNR